MYCQYTIYLSLYIIYVLLYYDFLCLCGFLWARILRIEGPRPTDRPVLLVYLEPRIYGLLVIWSGIFSYSLVCQCRDFAQYVRPDKLRVLCTVTIKDM